MANIVQISYKNPVHQIQLSMLAEVFERRIRHSLKSSLAMIETLEWRIFLMKDLSAAEEAQKHGVKLVEVEVKF